MAIIVNSFSHRLFPGFKTESSHGDPSLTAQTYRLNRALADPDLSVMKFLNEVKVNYPQSISFSAGRPAEAFFNLPERLENIQHFLQVTAAHSGVESTELWGSFGQYGKTDGLICDLLSDHLAKDEGINAQPGDIVVTTGCQEAMALVLMTLFRDEGDCLLTPDPTYIGITGLAKILGIQTVPIACDDDGMNLEALEVALQKLSQQGKRPKALYIIPDFNNPLGCDMPLAHRKHLLSLAEKHRFFIVEDNPYGAFVFEGERLPTLKALDQGNWVIYLGTFSKTLFPSLRLGFAVTSAQLRDDSGKLQALSEELVKVKSLTTVNTCALSQAVVGGELMACQGRLYAHLAEHIAYYRERRDAMLGALEKAFPPGDKWRELVHWNRPRGGFFMTLTLPFPFDNRALHKCVEKFGVVVVPMQYFSLLRNRSHQVRLSFCSNSLIEIQEGIQKFTQFIREFGSEPLT